MGSRANCRGPGAAAHLPGAQRAGPVSAPGGDQRRAQRCARGCRKPTGGRSSSLYDQLYALMPSAVVALNRAVAVAEIEGPVAALRLIEPLALSRYYLYHSVRADMLRRLGRSAEAAEAYREAIELAEMRGSAHFSSNNIWPSRETSSRNQTWVVVWVRERQSGRWAGENGRMNQRAVARGASIEAPDRVRLLAAGDGRSSLAVARDQIRGRESVQLCSAKLSNSARLMHVSSNLTCASGERNSGGQGEIRTHVPELPDHPISSRRRYDRFGTCPQETIQNLGGPARGAYSSRTMLRAKGRNNLTSQAWLRRIGDRGRFSVDSGHWAGKARQSFALRPLTARPDCRAASRPISIPTSRPASRTCDPHSRPQAGIPASTGGSWRRSATRNRAGGRRPFRRRARRA